MGSTRGIDMMHNSSVGQLVKTIRKPGFWFIVALLVVITLPHYGESLQHPAFLTSLISDLGLNRHAFERILYLAPIAWAGFMFGWKGSAIVSLVALVCMLPRAIFISQYPADALFESSAVFVVGNVLSVSFSALRKEREYRIQLELAHQELRASEERYRELFDNAHDSILLHDLDGNIITANKACAAITGYSLEELHDVKSGKLFAEDSLDNINKLEDPQIKGEASGYLSEAKMVRKDGAELIVQLSTTPVYSEGRIIGFQHIARDITEQKQLQDNFHFYLHQATRAQEEERKRISHELHDETIQALVVLSRQLDTLSSSGKELSEENRLRVEKLCQLTDNILRGIRRLSQDLRPAALDRLGLLPALEWLASGVKEYSGITTKVTVVGKEHRLPEEVELMLFRITQEALRNVWRHSGATSAEIKVEFEESRTKVTVIDNGKGFELPEKMGDLARYGKLGLAGMQERAQLVGGTLSVKSEPGKGTEVTMEIRS